MLPGLNPSASKYLIDTPSLLSFGSTIVMFSQFLTFDKISPQSKPIAPTPITKAFVFFIGFVNSFSLISTACKATAQGSAIGAYLISRLFGNSYIFLSGIETYSAKPPCLSIGLFMPKIIFLLHKCSLPFLQ